MIDMLAMWERLAEVFAAPRANISTIAILLTIALMLVVLSFVGIAIRMTNRKSEEYVMRGSDGRPYLVVGSKVTGYSNPYRKRYVILATASFAMCLLTAYLAWGPSL